MYQYWLINCNECPTLMQYVTNGATSWVEEVVVQIYGKSLLLLSFSVDLKLDEGSRSRLHSVERIVAPAPSQTPTEIPNLARCIGRGFPGGAVVENLPANAGDAGSSPGPGRSHMPRSN